MIYNSFQLIYNLDPNLSNAFALSSTGNKLLDVAITWTYFEGTDSLI